MWTDEQMRVEWRKMNLNEWLGGAHVELGVIYRAVELHGRFLEHIANRREVGIDQ